MVFRVQKNKNYVVMSNYHLKDKFLSLKAKGLLSIILSLPADWDYTQTGLVQLSTDKVSSLRSALNELRKYGYIKVIKKKPNETDSGRFEYEYLVYEEPQHIEIQEEIPSVYFSKIWERYPKKESEKEARLYFNKLNANEELVDEIIESINNHRRSKKWADKKYIPLLVNWLKQERWKDVFDPMELSSFDIYDDDFISKKGVKW